MESSLQGNRLISILNEAPGLSLMPTQAAGVAPSPRGCRTEWRPRKAATLLVPGRLSRASCLAPHQGSRRFPLSPDPPELEGVPNGPPVKAGQAVRRVGVRLPPSHLQAVLEAAAPMRTPGSQDEGGRRFQALLGSGCAGSGRALVSFGDLSPRPVLSGPRPWRWLAE